MDIQNKKSYSFSVQQSPNSENEHTAIVSVSLCDGTMTVSNFGSANSNNVPSCDTLNILNAARNDAQTKIQDQMNHMASHAIGTDKKYVANIVKCSSDPIELPASKNKMNSSDAMATEGKKQYARSKALNYGVEINDLCKDLFKHKLDKATENEVNKMINMLDMM